MRNYRDGDRAKVRIDFNQQVLNAASRKASNQGETLSRYVERLVRGDLLEGSGND
jgi:hypothetical protein